MPRLAWAFVKTKRGANDTNHNLPPLTRPPGRRLSPRAEKTIRLVATCVIAAPLGIYAVVDEDETLGFIAAGIVLAGIIAGSAAAKVLFPGAPGKGR